MIYLDNNATTMPDPRVVAAVTCALSEEWGNPSSLHRVGERARHAVECARVQVALLVGSDGRNVVFTSGGTESCNLAISSCLAGDPARRRIVTDPYEHSAVREVALAHAKRGGMVTWVDGDENGILDSALLENALAGTGDCAVVSIQWANNETGSIQNVADLGAVCRRHGVPFHVDATQWVGKEPTFMRSMPIDLLSLSAHKFHGPKGVGALVASPAQPIHATIIGGAQEHGRRAGTENVPGIVGMGEAAAVSVEWLAQGEGPRIALAAVRDGFEARVLAGVAGSRVIARDGMRIWSTSNIAFAHLEAEAILIALSRSGLCASAGAACSSGSLDPSPVLLAMGIPRHEAHGAVRFSFARDATLALAESAAAIVIECVSRVARSMPPRLPPVSSRESFAREEN
ncbi:MAG: cysteine desulfurase [Phycisphaerales bacterium]|nr:cysteine desulfurase [Phycisphaerales bacterium]